MVESRVILSNGALRCRVEADSIRRVARRGPFDVAGVYFLGVFIGPFLCIYLAGEYDGSA